jgi:hypothetical protein
MSATCLLCPSPAVADGLCVEDGARLWAAELWHRRPERFELRRARALHSTEASPRLSALRLLGPTAAHAFLDKLEAARKAREAAPLCKRGCMSHDGEGVET